jgi:hypothetical protein
MDEGEQIPETAEGAFWSWLGFWLQLLVLGVLAIIGAFFASDAARPGDYACGLILALGTTALAFMRLKSRLDGEPGRGNFLFVHDMRNLAVAIPLFTVIGLAGLFIAHAWETGAMHTAGVALFIVSGLIIFLDIKHVFDRIDAAGPH